MFTHFRDLKPDQTKESAMNLKIGQTIAFDFVPNLISHRRFFTISEISESTISGTNHTITTSTNYSICSLSNIRVIAEPGETVIPARDLIPKGFEDKPGKAMAIFHVLKPEAKNARLDQESGLIVYGEPYKASLSLGFDGVVTLTNGKGEKLEWCLYETDVKFSPEHVNRIVAHLS